MSHHKSSTKKRLYNNNHHHQNNNTNTKLLKKNAHIGAVAVDGGIGIGHHGSHNNNNNNNNNNNKHNNNNNNNKYKNNNNNNKNKNNNKKSSNINNSHSKFQTRLLPEEGTLFQPSLSLCLELVSKIYYRHLIKRDNAIGFGNNNNSGSGNSRDMEWEDRFDIDKFLAKKYIAVLPFFSVLNGASLCTYTQKHHRSYVSEPTETHVREFIEHIFHKLHLNVESSIVSLIYTERLMERRQICLTPRNWRAIVIASILTASKVWDDLSSWNIEFANLLPLLSPANINMLEGVYLHGIDYDLYIHSSVYAKYYFALRSLKNMASLKIPRYYLDLKIVHKNSLQENEENPSDLPNFNHNNTTTTHNLSEDLNQVSLMGAEHIMMNGQAHEFGEAKSRLLSNDYSQLSLNSTLDSAADDLQVQAKDMIPEGRSNSINEMKIPTIYKQDMNKISEHIPEKQDFKESKEQPQQQQQQKRTLSVGKPDDVTHATSISNPNIENKTQSITEKQSQSSNTLDPTNETLNDNENGIGIKKKSRSIQIPMDRNKRIHIRTVSNQQIPSSDLPIRPWSLPEEMLVKKK